MEKYTYIKKNISDFYITLDEQLPDTAYEIGTTLLDFYDNKWILLSDQQVAFHEENPNASIEDVLDMRLEMSNEQYELLLAKDNKINLIKQYDNSNEVNSFIIGDKLMWLDFDLRSRIRTSLEAYKATNALSMTKWFDGTEYTFTIQLWEGMLNMLEIYADEALNTTESHIATINSMNDILDINEYDITQNYPEKLIF